MIFTIQRRVLDILQCDPRLLQAGTVYGDSGTNVWERAIRVNQGDEPEAGAVNLYDTTYERAGKGRRPAIYLGTQAMQMTDRIDHVVLAGKRRVEFRVMLLPVVFAVEVSGKNDKYTAKLMAGQLVENAMGILFEHLQDNGHWWQLTIPGVAAGGQAMFRTWESATGDDKSGVADAMASMPVQIKYSYAGLGC